MRIAATTGISVACCPHLNPASGLDGPSAIRIDAHLLDAFAVDRLRLSVRGRKCRSGFTVRQRRSRPALAMAMGPREGSGGRRSYPYTEKHGDKSDPQLASPLRPWSQTAELGMNVAVRTHTILHVVAKRVRGRDSSAVGRACGIKELTYRLTIMENSAAGK